SHNPRLAQQLPSGWSAAAGNVARGYRFDQVVAAWMGYPGHRANILGSYTHIGIGYCEVNGYRFYTQVFARYSGSVSGDRVAANPVPVTGSAVLAVASGGALYRYPANGAGGFGSRQQVGSGWGSMALVSGVGDMTGDGRVDLVARDAGGRLLFYPGTAAGGFTGPIVIGPGWGRMNLIIGPGDMTGDGRGDLVARDDSGRLWLYAGRGDGRVANGVQIGKGWTGMSVILGPGDLTSDGRPDLVARDSAG